MDSEQRVSTAERQTAVDALSAHVRAGRLSAAEYEERSEIAKRAVTWHDLGQVFGDLPEPHPVRGAVPARAPQPAEVVSEPSQPPAPCRSVRSGVGTGRGLIPPEVGVWLVSASPFVALALFLWLQQWWWFLLIPIMSLLVYGPHEDRR